MTTILIAVAVPSSLMFFLFFITPKLPNGASVEPSYQRSPEKLINKNTELGNSLRKIGV
ncbi:hypothetical protein N9V88_03525 [bacterium]|jgi:hypothetical protein|nr:hypothetical protein [bacterium]